MIIIEPQNTPDAAIIWMHGLGADAHDFEPIVPELRLPESLRIRFIFPQAPIQPVTLNDGIPMPSWFDIYSLERFDHEDVEGMRASQAEIESLIQAQIDQGIAPARIILAGFSQGGAIALFTGLRYAKRLGGILALSTFLPAAKPLSHERSSANQSIPIFMAHGIHDVILPIPFGEMSEEHLKTYGYNVEWHEYAMSHEVCYEEIVDIAEWIKKILTP